MYYINHSKVGINHSKEAYMYPWIWSSEVCC